MDGFDMVHQAKTSRIKEVVRRLPKAELHIHLEGAFRWETIRTHHPKGSQLPSNPPWQGRPFAHFKDFLDAFIRYVRPATGTAAAIEQHTCEVLTDLAQQNVRYAEVIVSTSAHREQGLAQGAVLDAMAKGWNSATQATGIDARLVYGINRHQPVANSLAELTQALKVAGPQGNGLISGIDLQGDECVGSGQDFVQLFDLARRHGLRLRAHAGELRGASSVAEVQQHLQVKHLSHGVRATEDQQLLAQLQQRAVWFHVCVSSNIMLGIYPSFASHPLPSMLQMGCNVTINSDDPLLFGSNIDNEYAVLVDHFGFSAAQCGEMAKAGFLASMLDRTSIAQYSGEIDAILASP